MSVKTAAKFEVPAGDTLISLREKLSVAKLQKILSDNIEDSDSPVPSIYDYNPTQKESDVLQYIIDYPIQKFSLSVSDTDSDIDTISFSTDVNLNIQNKVNNPFNAELPSDARFPVVDAGDRKTTSIESQKVTVSTQIDFSSAVFSSGLITIPISPQSAIPEPSGFSFTVTASLYSGSRRLVSDSKDCTNGGVISLDVSGCTIDSTGVYVLLGGEISDTDGVAGAATYYYSFDVSLTDFQVAKVTGLNMSADEIGQIPVNETKPISGLSSCLKSAEIAAGAISFACAQPTGWSGIVFDDEKSSLSVTQTGGLSISDFKKENRSGYIVYETADLAGQTVNSSDVTINGMVDFSLKNATIDFSSGDKLTIEGTCEITELSELVVDLSKLNDTSANSGSVDTGINFSEMLSSFFEDDENLIENVKFSGVSGYLFVQQPTENETLENLSVRAAVSATFSTENSETTSSLVNDTITIKSLGDEDICTLASLADSNSMITKNWTDESDASKQIFSAKVEDGALDSLLNAHPENLSFDYLLNWGGSLGEITFTSEEINALKKNSSITVSLALVLPFQLIFSDVSDGTLDETITIEDVLALFGNEFDEDVLHRDEDFKVEDYTKYADIVESMSFNYTLTNKTPLEEITLTLYDEEGILTTTKTSDDGTEVTTAGKALSAENGAHSLAFTVDEIRKILETQPFIPKVRMEIHGADGETERKFARDAAFGIKGSVQLKTNGTVELWNKND